MKLFSIVPPIFFILLGAMIAGYAAKFFRLLEPSITRVLMVRMQKYVIPWVLLVSFWGLKVSKLSFFVIAFIGMGVIFLQFGMAYLVLKFMNLTKAQKGSFLVASLLANVGYLGWSINLSLFGQIGYDYAFVYGFYFALAVYLLAYPIAAKHSRSAEIQSMSFAKRLLVEGIVVYAVSSIVIGLALNFAGVPRPAVIGRLNSTVVLAATSIMMFAAGLSVSVRSFRIHAKASFVMAVIKSVLSPLVVAAVLLVTANHLLSDPLMFKVIVIESMMPLAISCLSVSAIFHLDQDLMNCIWVVSTLSFFAIFQVLLVTKVFL